MRRLYVKAVIKTIYITYAWKLKTIDLRNHVLFFKYHIFLSKYTPIE